MNLSQINPVAPMALDMDFKTHDKTTYPFNPVMKRPRCVKIVLNSGDRISGSTVTSAKYKINLPTDLIGKKLNMVVDSFIVNTTPSSVSNLSLYSYYIRILEHRNPYSYHSNTQTTTGMILTTTGTTYFNQSPRDVGGCTLVDSTLFDRVVTIDISSVHFDTTAASGVANAWTLSLSLWDDAE
jgi:hypothetical protein